MLQQSSTFVGETEEVGGNDSLPPDPDSLNLLVLDSDDVAIVALPNPCTYTIGRSPDAKIQLRKNKLVSRIHAVLRRRDDHVSIQDSGSKHGILFRGTRLGSDEVLDLPLGEGVEVGGVWLQLIRGRPRVAVFQLRDSDALLERACVRAKNRGTSVAIVHVCLDATVCPNVGSLACQAYQGDLKPCDHVVQIDPSVQRLAIVGGTGDEVRERTQKVIGALARSRILTRYSSAQLPDDGDSLAALKKAISDREPGSWCGPSSHRADVDRPTAVTSTWSDAEFENIAKSDLPIVLLGETGAGKTYTAERIHNASGRTGNFVDLNCAEFANEGLLQCELFGCVKGAFTGAVPRKGRIREAHGGTLFLDEIAELSKPTQAMLLKVLETKRVVPLGTERSIEVDFRLISATNKDLRAMTEDGSFRNDLYYRIIGPTQTVPPLRSRRQEIVRIAEELLEDFCTESRCQTKLLSATAKAFLLAQQWKGNVRALDSVIRSAVVLCHGETIEDADLVNALLSINEVPVHPPAHAEKPITNSNSGESISPSDPEPPNVLPTREEVIAAIKRVTAERAPSCSRYGFTKRLLEVLRERYPNLSKQQLDRKLKKYGLGASPP